LSASKRDHFFERDLPSLGGFNRGKRRRGKKHCADVGGAKKKKWPGERAMFRSAEEESPSEEGGDIFDDGGEGNYRNVNSSPICRSRGKLFAQKLTEKGREQMSWSRGKITSLRDNKAALKGPPNNRKGELRIKGGKRWKAVLGGGAKPFPKRGGLPLRIFEEKKYTFKWRE